MRIPSAITFVSHAAIKTGVARTVVAWSIMVAATIGDVRAADTPPTPVLVEVEQGDGTVTAGRLERIDAAGVHLADVAGGSLMVPGDRVRAVRRTSGKVEGGEKSPPRSRHRIETASYQKGNSSSATARTVRTQYSGARLGMGASPDQAEAQPQAVQPREQHGPYL